MSHVLYFKALCEEQIEMYSLNNFTFWSFLIAASHCLF